MEEDLTVKSELILGKGLKVRAGFDHPYAEPKGDGTGNIIVSFGNTRLRMKYSPESGDFELRGSDGRYSIYRGDECIIEDAGFVQAFCHSPYQANVNLSKFGSTEEIMTYLDRIVSTGTVKGIPVSGGESVDQVCDVIHTIHSRYPDIPIGYSAGPMSVEDMERLRDSGLSEFKIIVGSTIPRIFELLHPDEDMDEIMDCLRKAVGVFGKGKVCTGLTIGLGETDEEVIAMMKSVSADGILTDLKVKKIAPKNLERIESTLGHVEPLTVERLSMLGSKLKEVQERNGLDTRTMQTLCLACRCCNLVPFKDY